MNGMTDLNVAEFIFVAAGTYILFIGPVMATIVMLLLAVAGLLWSPFAAAVCGGIAHRKNWAGDRYAGNGFLGSIYLFLPWFYMLSRLCGRPMGEVTVIAGYIVLFLLWLFGAIIPGGIMSWAFFWAGDAEYGPLGTMRAQYTLNHTWTTAMGSIISVLVSLLLWAITLRKMWRIRRTYRQNVRVAPQERVVDWAYMRPFQCAWLSFVFIWGFHIYIFASYPVCIVAC